MNARNKDRRGVSRLTRFLLLAAVPFVFLIAEAQAQTGPPGYTFCANEGQLCSFSGTANVAYGANGTFVYRILTNGTPCTNAIFGDPLYGTIKACFYQIQPPPTLQFNFASYNSSENAPSAAITVTRAGSSVGAVSAAYSFQNSNANGGTACTEGVDYINTGGTVSFADGDTAVKTINVTLCNDTVHEGDEYFYITLQNPTGGAVVGSNSKAWVSIQDDESLVQFYSNQYYGSDGTSFVAVTVARGGRVGAVSASYSFTDSTAVGGAQCTAGVDYINTGGTVSFADGDDAAKTVNVVLCIDAAVEGIEFLTIALSNPTGNLTLGPTSTASVVIRDPGPATFTVNQVDDSGDGVCDATCTLRDALGTANGDTFSDDTIVFDPSVFSTHQTIVLTNWLGIFDEVTINGPGADLVSISGNSASQVFYITSDVTAALHGMTIRDGFCYYCASGIYNSGVLTLTNSTVTGNGANDTAGAGIYNEGTMTLINSTVSGNYGYAWEWGSAGGGIFNAGTMTIDKCTVSGNSAEYGVGGGIYSYGTLTINNSTISGNTTLEYGNGGGIYNYGTNGTLNLTNSTVSGNSAYSGGGIYSDAGNETLRNTIVAGNTGYNSGGEISGTIETGSHNLIGNAGSSGGIQNGVNGNIVGVNPLLESLHSNGGPTMTHSLLPGSLARNAGDNCVLTENGCGSTHAALPTDQRGMPRNGAVDIGSFERQADKNTRSVPFDFDGDRKADVSVYRNGEWLVYGSQAGSMITAWGNATDKVAAADFDGDGKTDYSVFRDGMWMSHHSSGSVSEVPWGAAGDIPVPADYDGDGRADQAVFRSGTWWIYRSTEGPIGIQWGVGTDIPVPADYDGDGKTDVAIVRDGTWWIYQSTAGPAGIAWGQAGDKPVPADYDGDDKADVAIVRNGTWWIYQSTLGATGIAWGNATDIPVPADYDGDGRSDVAVFREGTWWIYQSTLGATGVPWGNASDIPVPRK